MVIVEHAAETLTTHDAAAHGCVVVHRLDELVAEALVIALSVIVRGEFFDEVTQVAFTQRDDVAPWFVVLGAAIEITASCLGAAVLPVPAQRGASEPFAALESRFSSRPRRSGTWGSRSANAS